jgi:hypothetical protein
MELPPVDNDNNHQSIARRPPTTSLRASLLRDADTVVGAALATVVRYNQKAIETSHKV